MGGGGGGGATSPVDFKKWQCPLSILFKCSCLFYGGAMSPVEFKKVSCPPVEFKGQGPLYCQFIPCSNM